MSPSFTVYVFYAVGLPCFLHNELFFFFFFLGWCVLNEIVLLIYFFKNKIKNWS